MDIFLAGKLKLRYRNAMKNSDHQFGKFDTDLWAHVTEIIPPFGWTVQTLLSSKKLTQGYLADKLDIASSNLSGTLHGKRDRPLSDAFVEKISNVLHLSNDERCVLMEAAQLSKLNLTLRNAPPWKYSLAARFHRNLQTMEPNVARTIDSILALNTHRNGDKVADISEKL